MAVTQLRDGQKIDSITLTSEVTGVLPVANGGTNSNTLVLNTVLLGNGSGAVQQIAPSTSGNVLTSNGTTWSSSPAAGGIFPWTEVTGTSQTAAVNNGYIANNAGLVTITLPTTAALGSVIKVAGKGAGLFKVLNATGITTYFGNATTTASTGSISSTLTRDGIELLCITANTEWSVVDALGNFTIV